MRNPMTKQSEKSKWVLLMALGCLSLAATGCGKENAQASPTQQLQPVGGPDWYEFLRKRDAQYHKATETYGPLLVRTGVFTNTSPITPWSSSYFPNVDRWAFDDARTSALAKYDAYVKRTRGYDPKTRQWQSDRWTQEGGNSIAGWEGLCNAWSFASLIQAQPTRETNPKGLGIRFGVGDLKYLLFKTYEYTVPELTYGEDAAHPLNGTLPDLNDIYPDQFHRVLQAELLEQGRPFIIDRRPDAQVWNHPIYWAKTTIERDPSNPNRVTVSTLLLGANEVADRDYNGAMVNMPFEYDYELFGTWQADGNFKVELGFWMGGSRLLHPDYVIPLQDFKRGSPQEAIDRGYVPNIDPKIVDEILANPAS